MIISSLQLLQEPSGHKKKKMGRNQLVQIPNLHMKKYFHSSI